MRRKLCSEIITLALDHPDHAAFREELWVVVAEHGCRYYLSMLEHRDYYDAEYNVFETDLIAYFEAASPPFAQCWSESRYFCEFALPILCERFLITTKFPTAHRLTKEDRALILLLKHPDWDDQAILSELSTIAKQLARWSKFQLARREQKQS